MATWCCNPSYIFFPFFSFPFPFPFPFPFSFSFSPSFFPFSLPFPFPFSPFPFPFPPLPFLLSLSLSFHVGSTHQGCQRDAPPRLGPCRHLWRGSLRAPPTCRCCHARAWPPQHVKNYHDFTHVLPKDEVLISLLGGGLAKGVERLGGHRAASHLLAQNLPNFGPNHEDFAAACPNSPFLPCSHVNSARCDTQTPHLAFLNSFLQESMNLVKLPKYS